MTTPPLGKPKGGGRRLAEAPPDPAVLDRLDACESHVNEQGEPDLEGMRLAELAEWQHALMSDPVHGYHQGSQPPAPTDAAPGSPEKIKVMRWRALRGYALSHPRDARIASHPLFSRVGNVHEPKDE
jgi:hypothetical protein